MRWWEVLVGDWAGFGAEWNPKWSKKKSKKSAGNQRSDGERFWCETEKDLEVEEIPPKIKKK